MFNLSVHIVSADSTAPFCARAAPGTVMTTVGSANIRDQHLKGWHIEAETKWPPFCRHFVNVITIILTVKFKRNNTAFTKENSLKGQFNWNMNENAPILRYIFAKADMWCAWRRMKGALLPPTPDHRLGGGGSTCDIILIGHFTNVKRISYFQYVICDTPQYAVGSGHGTAAVLLPAFAINW